MWYLKKIINALCHLNEDKNHIGGYKQIHGCFFDNGI